MGERKLFGTDGIRGIANAQLTPQLAMQLGQSAAAVLASEHPRPRVLIARDTRQSGDMLEAALAAGFSSAGCDVELLGILPTPTLAWLVREEDVQLGAMISASHNPAPDNGIKLFSGTGSKLSDAVELQIESGLHHPERLNEACQAITGARVGRIQLRDATASARPYLEALLGLVNIDLKGLRVALDTAHGAMYKVAPEAFRLLGMDPPVLFAQPDGMNINLNCGSTHLEALQEYVIANQLDLGVAFDGDGDRCLLVGPQGQMLDGDFILYLCSRYLPAYAQSSAVVATVMSNLGLEQALSAQGKQLLRTAVGDRYVLETMQSEGYLLGGEQSGHIIFGDIQVTGDGLLTALQTLQAIQHSGKPLTELLAEVKTCPQLLKNVVVESHWQRHWHEHTGFQAEIAQAEQVLVGNGRLLIRASGTEPKLRVMAEGDDAERVEQVVNQLVAYIQEEMVSS
jgi:phosphoglucosamine mutase